MDAAGFEPEGGTPKQVRLEKSWQLRPVWLTITIYVAPKMEMPLHCSNPVKLMYYILGLVYFTMNYFKTLEKLKPQGLVKEN
jgi:hypothetical protein